MTKQTVGFIGLGVMGSGMGLNVRKAGFPLTVYNRTQSKATELVRQGAGWAGSPRDVAAKSEIIITMVSDPAALKDVILGETGVLSGVRAGSVIIDMSTVDPETTIMLAREAAGKSVDYLDCPVTGSKIGASEGTLTIMAGGKAEVIERCRPVLLSMGKRIIHAGKTGSGSYLKLFNNLLLAGCYEAFSEALVFGTKAGLPSEKMMELIQAGLMNCKLFDLKGNAVLKRDFSQNFSTALMHKDLGLILGTARRLNVSLPAVALTNEVYNAAEGLGLSQEDYCSVIKVHESLSGAVVKEKEK